MFQSRAFLLSLLVGFTAAKDVHLDWNITWVWAAPDGFGRPMIGINDEWPCPLVNADLGDRLIVDVHNGLGNQSTGIHWHGFHQYMTGTMDGSNQVTQCALPPGSRMRYEFNVNQTGTYWYHSHEMGQYPDGLRGPLIVRDPSPPFDYDGEFTLTLTDHYHEQMHYLLQQYEADSVGAHAGGNEPLPAAALINEGLNSTTLHVEPNKTYLVHLICVGNWPGHVIVFDDHEISVVEVDGTWVDTYPVGDKKIRLASGQRMSILLRTKDNADANYAIWDSMDVNMMFIYENRDIPEGFNPNATAWLVYDEEKELPAPPDIHDLDPNTDFVDDLVFVPVTHEPVLEPVDHQIILDTSVTGRDGRSEFTINGNTYVEQEQPTMYTALAASPDDSSDPSIYGQVNPFVVEYGQVVEIIINNRHANLHPWHLHGHQFQVLQRTIPEGGYFDGYFANISATPVKRDTIMLQNHGHAVLRFRADNPDKLPSPIWLIHCHIEWHVTKGLTATIIEAPARMHEIDVPLDHQRICPSYGTPTGASYPPNDKTPGQDTQGSSPAPHSTQPGASPEPSPEPSSGPSPAPQSTPQPAPSPEPSPEPSSGPSSPPECTPQPGGSPSNTAPSTNNNPSGYGSGYGEYPSAGAPAASEPILIDSEYHSGGKVKGFQSSHVNI